MRARALTRVAVKYVQSRYMQPTPTRSAEKKVVKRYLLHRRLGHCDYDPYCALTTARSTQSTSTVSAQPPSATKRRLDYSQSLTGTSHRLTPVTHSSLSQLAHALHSHHVPRSPVSQRNFLPKLHHVNQLQVSVRHLSTRHLHAPAYNALTTLRL